MGLLRFASRLPAAFAAVVVATLLGGRPAQAQSLSISTAGITRREPFRSDQTNRFKVSRADCLADDAISFPLIVGSFGGSTLEVWATYSTSDDCRTDVARTSATATCWRVFRTVPTSTTPTVSIRVQDIAARPLTTEGMDVGTAASCNTSTSTGQPVTLWFMFLQGTTQAGMAGSWPTSIDLLGPSPPAVDGIGVGGGLLKMSWKQNTDPDVLGYRLFCENLGATGGGGVTIYDAGAPGPEGGGGTICPDAGSGTGSDADDDAGDASDEDGGAPTDGGATTDVCTPGTGGAGGSTGGTSGCGSVLVSGQTLTPEQIAQYSCGSKAGLSATSALVSGLNNFERYAVAIAAFDLVENIGSLSSVQCGTPQPVNGFDEVYRSAGGTAGGASFCSLGPRSVAARAKLWPVAAFAALVALGQKRRRSRQPNIK